MEKKIDARGLACPQPVILTKKAMEAGAKELLVEVDNATAVENLSRLAQSQGYTFLSSGDNPYLLKLHKSEGTSPDRETLSPKGTGISEAKRENIVDSVSKGLPWALLCGTDVLGSGERELGTNLIRMYFYTLSQAEAQPGAILFINAGVKLPALDEQVTEHLKVLAAGGCRILACGTCLDFYHLKEQLKVGRVSNMYDIVSCLAEYPKVLTLG